MAGQSAAELGASEEWMHPAEEVESSPVEEERRQDFSHLDERSRLLRATCEGRAVIVRNLPSSWTKERLLEFFGGFGEVVEASINGKGKERLAFLIFDEHEQAADSVEVCDDMELEEPAKTRLWCSVRTCMFQAREQGRSLYFQGIPNSFNEEKVKEVFECGGIVDDVRILPSKVDSQPKIGFVQMRSKEDATYVMTHLPSKVLLGCKVQVRLSNESKAEKAEREEADLVLSGKSLPPANRKTPWWKQDNHSSRQNWQKDSWRQESRPSGQKWQEESPTIPKWQEGDHSSAPMPKEPTQPKQPWRPSSESLRPVPSRKRPREDSENEEAIECGDYGAWDQRQEASWL